MFDMMKSTGTLNATSALFCVFLKCNMDSTSRAHTLHSKMNINRCLFHNQTK